jgi:selenocysteine lyase/cysteine desulfurase
MSVDWAQVRRQFPALKHWTYLNTATYGQLPLCAQQAIRDHLERRDELACTDFLSWFDDADRIRASIARLIHCQADDIAFIHNASVSISLLIGGIDWRPGDRLVTLPHEFPNNIYYPALLASRGAEFVETPWERFYEAITPQTRLVALSTVNYTHGFRPPLAEISRFLRQRGVLFYVDGTQSLGALEFDVREVQPDLLAVDAYKWLLGPNGSGFMYVAPSLRERLAPSVIGWRSHRDWRNVDNLHHGAPEFSQAAEKYEGGMLVFPSLYAMGASIEMILDLGPAAIEARVMELAGKLRALLRGLGATLPSDVSPHFDSPVVAAGFEGVDASLLARKLKQQRVLISARHGYLRISTHFYNNEEDLARLETELRSLQGG